MQELGERGTGYDRRTVEEDPEREEQRYHAGEAAGHAALAGEGGGQETVDDEDKSVGSLSYYRDYYADMDWTPEEL